jgi:DNA-binding NarL/FixJ family response regulator
VLHVGAGVVTDLPTVLLVDDHDVVRAGTRMLLADEFDVIGEADNAQSAIELALEREPDLVLVDVRLPGGGGAHVVEALRRRKLDSRLVAFTVSLAMDDVRAMMDAGVDGYITKTTHREVLVDMLQRALAGGRPVSKEVAAHLLDIDDDVTSEAELTRLTPREREVVNLIARGYTYRETAADLGISVKTLENHMSSIFRKLGVASRHQLAARLGGALLRPDEQA